jgi:hypothetical protein
MAGLEVQIGADKSDFDKKIKEVEYDVKQLAKEKQAQIKLGLDTREITAQIKDAKKSLMDLRTTAKDAGTSFSKDFAPKVATGGNALMQFSRIAQDAPYGIIGIGNNITATVEAFGHLKNSTGSTGSALKAMASSIMGSGGILLGVSLLTTGLTYLAQSGLSVGDLVNKLTGDFDALGNSFKVISEEAKKSSAEQISSLKGLIAIAQDENQTKQRRLEIVDQIQKQYPNYFGNLSTEKIMYGNLTGVVNELTQALVNKAIAEKFAGTTAESTVKLWQANAKLVKSKEELLKAETDYNSAVKDPSKSQSMQFFASNVDRASDRVKEAREEVLKFNKEVERGQNIINMASKKASGVIAQPLKQPKTKKAEVVGSTPQVSGVQSSLSTAGLVDVNTIAVQTGAVDKFGNKIKELPGIITTSMGEVRLAFDTGGADALEALQQLNADMNELITGSIADTFSQLGTSIGEALATGGNVFAAIGTSLLQSLGKFLSEMGGMLIQYGTLAVVKGKLDLAIAAGGPLSIGAGLAAIAVGVALKAVGGAISSKAKSGGSGGSVSTGASVSSPSSSTGSSSGGSSFQGGTVVFEISGQSLIGVLGNTLDKNRRLGGSLSLG